MPNKRNPNRKAFGIALNIDTIELLKAEATRQGTNISNLLEKLTLERYGNSEQKTNRTNIKKSTKDSKKTNEK